MILSNPKLAFSNRYLNRITAAWCQTHDVPIEKIFSKALVKKCKYRTGTTFLSKILISSSPLGHAGRAGLEILELPAAMDSVIVGLFA